MSRTWGTRICCVLTVPCQILGENTAVVTVGPNLPYVPPCCINTGILVQFKARLCCAHYTNPEQRWSDEWDNRCMDCQESTRDVLIDGWKLNAKLFMKLSWRGIHFLYLMIWVHFRPNRDQIIGKFLWLIISVTLLLPHVTQAHWIVCIESRKKKFIVNLYELPWEMRGMCTTAQGFW